MVCVKSYLYSWFFGPYGCLFVNSSRKFTITSSPFFQYNILLKKKEKNNALNHILQKYTEYLYKKCNYTNTLLIKLPIVSKAKAARKWWIYFWNLVPLCLMWCIWRERNQRTFDDLDRSDDQLLALFIGSLFYWS